MCGDVWPLEKGDMHRIFYTDPSRRRHATRATPREPVISVPERCYMAYRKIYVDVHKGNHRTRIEMQYIKTNQIPMHYHYAGLCIP